MRKFFCFFAIILISLPSLAQDDGEGFFIARKEKNNAFFIGPKVGGVISSMTDPDDCHLNDGSGVGISAGLAMKMRFGKATENSNGGTGFFGVGLELKYKQNSVKTIGTDETGEENAKLSLGYFEVPVYIQVYPFAKANALNSLYVELGASFAIALSVSPESLTVSNTRSGYESITYNLDSDGSKLVSNDIRPLVGIGYTIPNTGLDINARYYIGASELAKNFSSKINSFEISLAWMFNAFKF